MKNTPTNSCYFTSLGKRANSVGCSDIFWPLRLCGIAMFRVFYPLYLRTPFIFSLLLSWWHCPCCAHDWSLNIFAGQASTCPSKCIHVPQCYKGRAKNPTGISGRKIKQDLCVLPNREHEISDYTWRDAVRLAQAGELGPSKRLSHCSVEFLVGICRLASLWKTLG